MAGKRGPIGKLIEALKDGVSDALDQLAPQPDAVPIPVRDRGAPPRR